jgi:hypothetical protein
LQYHQIVQTLLVEIFGPLSIAFLLLVIVFGFRNLIRQFRSRQTPGQLQAARDAFRARLVHPNATQVEQGIGALLPQRLLTLYEDHQTILTEQLEIAARNSSPDESAEWIEAFLPLDLESQKLACDLSAQGWGKGFCFATDGAGNFYWVPASDTRQLDAPVFFANHEPVANEKVTDSLDEFLSRPRTIHSGEEALVG